jgi:hypothetical protein
MKDPRKAAPINAATLIPDGYCHVNAAPRAHLHSLADRRYFLGTSAAAEHIHEIRLAQFAAAEPIRISPHPANADGTQPWSAQNLTRLSSFSNGRH